MPKRIGLHGRGRWAATIARTLAAFSDVCVVPVGSQDGLSLQLDGVIIANKSSEHAATAVPYIQAGIATFIEKPMATSVADAEWIRSVALESNAAVLVGHLHLYNPAFDYLLTILPELESIDFIASEGANNRPRQDSSVLWDWLPHDLSMLNVIFGRPPDTVAAWQLCQEALPHAALVRFSFGDQTCVSNVSWRSHIARKSFVIMSQERTLEFNDKLDDKVVVHSKDGVCSKWRYPREAQLPLAREMSAFLDIVRTRQTTRQSLDLGVAIAHCIAAAEQSIMQDGRAVRVFGGT